MPSGSRHQGRGARAQGRAARLARYVAFAKNKATDWQLNWADGAATGFPSTTPPANAFWLMFLIDNTMHLSINYASLRWL